MVSCMQAPTRPVPPPVLFLPLCPSHVYVLTGLGLGTHIWVSPGPVFGKVREYVTSFPRANAPISPEDTE